jgi:hypothetical protein
MPIPRLGMLSAEQLDGERLHLAESGWPGRGLATAGNGRFELCN